MSLAIDRLREGAFSVVQVCPTANLTHYTAPNRAATDADALAGDWAKIGEDIQTGMNRIREDRSHGQQAKQAEVQQELFAASHVRQA